MTFIIEFINVNFWVGLLIGALLTFLTALMISLFIKAKESDEDQDNNYL